MKLKTVNIKGKNYVEVNERLKYFRANFKGYSLTSDIIDLSDTRVVIKAIIRSADGIEVASGLAYEDKQSSYINKTSFVENCETSAWGRALGNFGIGIDASVASADEVEQAISQQASMGSKRKLDASTFKAMKEAANEGKAPLVAQRMANYQMTDSQKKQLTELIKTNSPA